MSSTEEDAKEQCVTFTFTGHHLAKMMVKEDGMLYPSESGLTDAYMTISRSGERKILHKTKRLFKTRADNSSFPRWEPFAINMWELCLGDVTRGIKFEVYDKCRAAGHDDLIGSFTTTFGNA